MSLTIHVLGPLVIKSDDCRLDKLPKKARALLAFLAAQNGEAVSRERLADLLWPYQGTEQGRHSLRNCLLELRKALGRGAACDLVTEFANAGSRTPSSTSMISSGCRAHRTLASCRGQPTYTAEIS